LDRPVFEQYVVMLRDLASGQLGYSLTANRPVTVMIGEQLGATLTLGIGALIIGTGLGIGLGTLSATAKNRMVVGVTRLLVAFSLASPVYWTGMLAIYVFSVWLRWLPSTGFGNDLRTMILPWSVLGVSIAGSIARVTGTELTQALRASFMLTARGKGLPERRVISNHALRAALVPIVTIIALQAGFLLGGAVLTEAIFVRQGIGQLMLRAVNERDYTVVQGIVIVSTLIYGVANLMAEVVIGWADPRLRFSAADEGL
jgi:ABC-type dipeptide/oligopeptide/nickel transport system permease component